MVYCEMTPKIGESIHHLQENIWMLGPRVICEYTTNEIPKHAVHSWPDRSGYFFLRKTGEEKFTKNEDLKEELMYEGGVSAAIWTLGPNYLCKVKGWVPGMESEGDSIQFVKDHCSSIPLPEIVFHWIDEAENRSYLIMKRVEGKTLRDAWDTLTIVQRAEVAQQIAKFVEKLSSFQLDQLQSPHGHGLQDQFLQSNPEYDHPSWKARPVGPFEIDDALAHFAFLGKWPLHLTRPLCLYHADLNPGNIMLDKDGKVIAIIDWESAGYYPKFWIAQKPMISTGFFIDHNKCEGDGWKIQLVAALGEQGFLPAFQSEEEFTKWRGKVISPEEVQPVPCQAEDEDEETVVAPPKA